MLYRFYSVKSFIPLVGAEVYNGPLLLILPANSGSCGSKFRVKVSLAANTNMSIYHVTGSV